MGVKRMVVAVCFTAAAVSGYAQQETLPAKRYNHFIGVQANQLIRQIINLNNSNSSEVDNPYLLIYSINRVSDGWGLNAGIGYNYNKITDVLPVARETRVNDLFYRFGINRRTMIGKRFEAEYGIDFAGDYQLSKTTSMSVTVAGQITDSSISIATTKTTSIGAGPRGYLGYYFSNRLILGTEISYYFLKSKQKENANVTDNITDPFNGNSVSTANSNVEKEISEFSFNLPVALFLILKF